MRLCAGPGRRGQPVPRPGTEDLTSVPCRRHQRPFACGWLDCRPVSGGGGISEQSSTVLGGGGMAEHDSLVVGGNGIADRDRSVVGAVGIIEHDSAVMGAAGMAEQSSAILGGGGISEHDSLVVGGGGIAEQDNAMLGGGGIAVPVSAILGGGGTTGTVRTSSSASPEVTNPFQRGSIPLMLRPAPRPHKGPDRASQQRGQKPRQTGCAKRGRCPRSSPPRLCLHPAHPGQPRPASPRAEEHPPTPQTPHVTQPRTTLPRSN
jgi:hypothetical protein